MYVITAARGNRCRVNTYPHVGFVPAHLLLSAYLFSQNISNGILTFASQHKTRQNGYCQEGDYQTIFVESSKSKHNLAVRSYAIESS